MKLLGFMLLVGLLWHPCCNAQAATNCPSSTNVDDDNQLEIRYLEAIKDNINDDNNPCVASAIHILGDRRISAAVRTLVKYLDYKEPLTGTHKLKAEGGIGDLGYNPYPAVNALFQIGKPAIPSLVDTMKDRDISS